jgi:molecular chaperone GrpE
MMTKDNEAIRPEDLEWVPASREAEGAAVETEKGQDAAGAEQLPPIVEQKIKEAAEAQEKYLRTYADFENYRKRTQRDLADFRKYANEQLAAEFLTVVDHLGLALKHATEAGEAGQGLREGVELVYKQIRDVLEKYGVKPFASEGEKFDPAKHDAVMQEATDRVPENTVVQVFQEGYLYHDKVLRHAKVSVAKKPASASEHHNTAE